MKRLLVLLACFSMWASQPPQLSRPTPGASVIDPVFGGKIIRISSPKQGTVCTHQYSTWSPFNADRSRLLMMCFDDLNGTNPTDWIVNLNADGTPASYTKITSLRLGVSTGVEWDRADPDILYHLKAGAKIYQYDFGAKTDTLVKNLTALAPNATRLQVSNDGDVFSMGKQDREWVHTGVLVWRRSTDQVKVNLAKSTVGYKPELSTDGAFVAAFENGASQDCYIRVSDASYSCYSQSATDRPTGHGDFGDSVLVHWEPWESSIIKHAALPESTWSTVFPFGFFGFSFHGSLTLLTPDEMVVGTSRACPVGETFPDYSNELFKVVISSGATARYAHSRANPCNGSSTNYWQTVRPAWSWDGRFIAYTSNWYPETNWATVADLYIVDTQPSGGGSSRSELRGSATLTGHDGRVGQTYFTEATGSSTTLPFPLGFSPGACRMQCLIQGHH